VPAVLEATGLTVRRGCRTVLSDVSLTLCAGEAIHVAGANGSGKTSLLPVLAGLSVPRGGVMRRPLSCAFVPGGIGKHQLEMCPDITRRTPVRRRRGQCRLATTALDQ